MPRNMSFSITPYQILLKSKTVTRRLGWRFLKPDDIVNAVEKSRGLKKGEKVKRLCQIKIKSTRIEPLHMIDSDDCIREGFPFWTPGEFIGMFCDHHKCKSDIEINRIEFEYIQPQPKS